MPCAPFRNRSIRFSDERWKSRKKHQPSDVTVQVLSVPGPVQPSRSNRCGPIGPVHEGADLCRKPATGRAAAVGIWGLTFRTWSSSRDRSFQGFMHGIRFGLSSIAASFDKPIVAYIHHYFADRNHWIQFPYEIKLYHYLSIFSIFFRAVESIVWLKIMTYTK